MVAIRFKSDSFLFNFFSSNFRAHSFDTVSFTINEYYSIEFYFWFKKKKKNNKFIGEFISSTRNNQCCVYVNAKNLGPKLIEASNDHLIEQSEKSNEKCPMLWMLKVSKMSLSINKILLTTFRSWDAA